MNAARVVGDPTDWRIIRELYGWQHGNYPEGALRVGAEELAERTELHPKTVRARVRALREAGVISGPFLEPRPDAFGHHVSAHMLEGTRNRSAQQIGAAVAGVPSTQLVVFAKDYAYVVFWHEPSQGRPVELGMLERALGASRSWKSFSSADFPSAPMPALSDLDRRIILAMRERPALSLAMVARRLAVTSRTVERRVKRIVAGGLGTTQIRFHPARLERTLYVHYVVKEGDARAAASLANAFPDRVIGPFGPQVRPNVGVAVQSVEEAESRLANLEGMPGIRDVGLYFVRDWMFPTRFDDWLAALVAKGASRVREGDMSARTMRRA